MTQVMAQLEKQVGSQKKEVETSDVPDVKPAEYFVEVTKREKRTCKKCEKQGVVAAPLADAKDDEPAYPVMAGVQAKLAALEKETLALRPKGKGQEINGAKQKALFKEIRDIAKSEVARLVAVGFPTDKQKAESRYHRFNERLYRDEVQQKISDVMTDRFTKGLPELSSEQPMEGLLVQWNAMN